VAPQPEELSSEKAGVVTWASAPDNINDVMSRIATSSKRLHQVIKDANPEKSPAAERLPQNDKVVGPNATKDTPPSGTATDRTVKSNKAQVTDSVAQHESSFEVAEALIRKSREDREEHERMEAAMESLEFNHNDIAAIMTKVRPAATDNTVDLHWDLVQTPEKTSTQEQGRTSVSKPSPEELRKEWIANMRKPLATSKGPKMDIRPHGAQAQGVPQDAPITTKHNVTNPDNAPTS